MRELSPRASLRTPKIRCSGTEQENRAPTRVLARTLLLLELPQYFYFLTSTTQVSTFKFTRVNKIKEKKKKFLSVLLTSDVLSIREDCTGSEDLAFIVDVVQRSLHQLTCSPGHGTSSRRNWRTRSLFTS